MGDIRSSSFSTSFGSTSDRPTNPTIGQTFYNGTLGYLEIYTVSGWIPATGANDFSLNITGTNTVVTFSQTYSSGSYSIVSLLNDSTIDIYAYGTDGSLAGYTNSKSFMATQRFNKVVVLGGSTGDVLQFSYKTTYATSTSTTDTAAGPYITNITPSFMANINDTITITGGNFATNVAVTFTGTGYSATAAKSIVRSSSTSLIVTRPDNFPPSASPFTITVTNPSVANQPTGSNVHIASNAVTAGSAPIWTTTSPLPVYTKNVAYSTTLVGTDSDGGSSIVYSIASGSLPTGFSLNSSSGVISGTNTTDVNNSSFTIRITDSGGNYVDRTFVLNNIGSSAPVWVTPAGALTSAVTGNAYSVQLSATDDSGNAPTYSLISGTLPSGLTLSSSGLISGTPTAGNGNANLTIRATDQNGTYTDRIFTIGTIVYTSINSSTTWTVPSGVTSIDYILAAGGGGGAGAGNNVGAAGGGAGGVITATGITVTPGTGMPVVIGAGATFGQTVGDAGWGYKGSNSSFNGQTVTGGGGGQAWSNGNTQDGGSGGGGYGSSGGGNYGAGTSGQGNNGGARNNQYDAPGGGGKGGAGGNGGTPGTAGAGGSAYQWINGIYYAGGGGGQSSGQGGGVGAQTASGGTNAGNGGGGNGTANRAGGGGGSCGSSGGSGGSGVLVIKYTG